MQKRISKGEAVFIVVNYIFLFLCVLITLLPFATIIAKSFSDSAAIESGKVFLWRLILTRRLTKISSRTVSF